MIFHEYGVSLSLVLKVIVRIAKKNKESGGHETGKLNTDCML